MARIKFGDYLWATAGKDGADVVITFNSIRKEKPDEWDSEPIKFVVKIISGFAFVECGLRGFENISHPATHGVISDVVGAALAGVIIDDIVNVTPTDWVMRVIDHFRGIV